MHGVLQMITTPYNPWDNLICERSNHALLNLLETLPKDHKENWLTYIPSLVFANNSTPQYMNWLPILPFNICQESSNSLQQLVRAFALQW